MVIPLHLEKNIRAQKVSVLSFYQLRQRILMPSVFFALASSVPLITPMKFTFLEIGRICLFLIDKEELLVLLDGQAMPAKQQTHNSCKGAYD